MSFEDEIERKFLISGSPPGAWPVDITESVIVQTYLNSEDPEVTERVRRRRYFGWEARSEYTHNRKVFVSKGHFKESEKEITPEEYAQLKKREDTALRQVRKIRQVFDWEGHTWELDLFVVPSKVDILEVELPSLDTPITLPPFLTVEREVTGEQGWSNYAMAGKDWVRPS